MCDVSLDYFACKGSAFFLNFNAFAFFSALFCKKFWKKLAGTNEKYYFCSRFQII